MATRGQAGQINQPTDVAGGPKGEVFVAQGQTPGANGDPRVLKFDKNGKFLKSWGGKGKGPGQFDVAHGIAIDASGRLWVADRENQRVQIFDQDGNYLKELRYAGLPCSLQIDDRYIHMVNGFAGQLLPLHLHGNVLSAPTKAATKLVNFV